MHHLDDRLSVEGGSSRSSSRRGQRRPRTRRPGGRRALPVTCSGDRYRGVPIIVPGMVSRAFLVVEIVRERQAEIEQLHAMRREKDVRRLQVAVNQAVGVQRVECRQRRQDNRDGIASAAAVHSSSGSRATRLRAAPWRCRTGPPPTRCRTADRCWGDSRARRPSLRGAAAPCDAGSESFARIVFSATARFSCSSHAAVDDAHAALSERAGNLVPTDCLHRL